MPRINQKTHISNDVLYRPCRGGETLLMCTVGAQLLKYTTTSARFEPSDEIHFRDKFDQGGTYCCENAKNRQKKAIG